MRPRGCHGLGTVLVLAWLGISTAHAEVVAQRLTLEQALGIGPQSEPKSGRRASALAQAQTNLDLAWTALFPTVAAQGKYTRNNIAFTVSDNPTHNLTVQPKNQLDGSVSFSRPLLVPSAYAGVQAATEAPAASEAQFEASQTTILLSVAQAFYAAAITDEVMSARESNIEVARATLQNAETRFNNGSVTRVDVDRAELALVRAQQGARESRFAQEQAYRALATLIQSDRSFKVHTIPANGAMEAPFTLESALRLRPEFRALELSMQSADAQRRAYAWRWAPTLSAFGGLRAFNYDNFASERHSWAVGAQLDWVLYDGGVRDVQRRLARAQERSRLPRLRSCVMPLATTWRIAPGCSQPSVTHKTRPNGQLPLPSKPSTSCAHNTQPGFPRRSICCRHRTDWWPPRSPSPRRISRSPSPTSPCAGRLAHSLAK